MSEQPKKYFIRFSNVEDHDNIMKFYEQNPHKNVSARNEEMMKTLADNGSVTIIEDEKGTIVGASISYPLEGKDGASANRWMELGTTRMVLNGYPGLFDAMIAMQVLRAYLVEPPDDRFVCQMEGSPVRKMAHKLGFRPLVPSQELVDASDDTLNAEETCGFDKWYSAGPEALPVLAKFMRDVMDKPYLENPVTGDKITLDFNKSKFFKLFEEEIRNLADRDFGNPDTPDVKKGIAKNRQEWMRWYFK